MYNYWTEETLKWSKNSKSHPPKVINCTTYLRCPECDGDGELYTSHRFTCGGCDGHGYVTEKYFLEQIKQENEHIKKREVINKIEKTLSRLNIKQLEELEHSIIQMATN